MTTCQAHDVLKHPRPRIVQLPSTRTTEPSVDEDHRAGHEDPNLGIDHRYLSLSHLGFFIIFLCNRSVYKFFGYYCDFYFSDL
ncbi:hypothetical protein CsatA_020979 [Cannabis sativa]